MTRWLISLLLLALLGGFMRTNASHRRAQIMRDVEEDVEGASRFVDVGVRLVTVVADPKGERLLHGKPKLRILRERKLGGIADTHANPPSWTPGSEYPVTWYCSPDQEHALLHNDLGQLGQLIYGSEGAGKTRLLCMWHYMRWLEHFGEGREAGQTAPVLARLGLVRLEMQSMYPRSWGRYVARDEFEGFEMCDGTRIRFRYTHQQSAAKGAPIQGYNWSWCGRDEMQDQVDAHEDIESRGRSSRLVEVDGKEVVAYQQLATATAKDDPEWRTLRDILVTSGHWVRRELSIFRSPFIGEDFLEKKKTSTSPREFLRRFGDPKTHRIEDLPPERATYPDWSREHNLITVPEIGWEDVTAHELRGVAPNRPLLVGHDPGTLVDVSLFIKAYVPNQHLGMYRRGKFAPWWVVRGELNTEGTTEFHLVELLKTVRQRWQLNLLTNAGKPNPTGNQILVRADPASNTPSTTGLATDKSVYTQFVNAGIHIKPAAYNAQNDGHGKVPLNAGIEVINTLICNAAGQRRFYVERLPDGKPAAPMLVAAIETSEKDLAGKAEANKKIGMKDPTHWCAAARYALWAIERPRLQLLASEGA